MMTKTANGCVIRSVNRPSAFIYEGSLARGGISHSGSASRLWQAESPLVGRFCPDLDHLSYKIWRPMQPAILALSYFGGLYFGLTAFFWLGAIRLVFT